MRPDASHASLPSGGRDGSDISDDASGTKAGTTSNDLVRPWSRYGFSVTFTDAILNYLYAIVETETTIAIQRMGLDPSLGLMHADKRYRPSLASDLMEPVRPIADRIAIEMLSQRVIGRQDAVETRKGVCRLGPGLARELGQYSDALREGVGPHVGRLTRELLRAPEHATPLTQSRHRASLDRV